MSATKQQIDWSNLHQKAQQVSNNAYAPYSQFRVGAAAISETNQVFSGCNVENASYGLTVCAERNCIAAAIAQGATSIKALAVYTPQEQLTSPCGACRQVIAEFMTPESIVSLVNHRGDSQQWRVKDLLPDAFTPQVLKQANKTIVPHSSSSEQGSC